MQRVCVFCGSSRGIRPEYALAAEQFAHAIARAGLGLVYGGGNVGLMAVLADTALADGVEVIGVIPEALQQRELGHAGLHELYVVGSMHERKAKMAALADAFIALPGGLGTLEELFEVWTWGQLGFHQKPVALFEVDDYWQPLITMVDRMVHEGFVPVKHRRMLLVDDDPTKLLVRLSTWEAPDVHKWIGEDET